jgi:hypothetical protein
MGAGDILYSLYKPTLIFVDMTTAFSVSQENGQAFAAAQC